MRSDIRVQSPLYFHQCFERWAATIPTAPALRWDGESICYAELNARANRVAHALRARGIGEEDRVGLYLPRSPDLIVAILGVLKAGACYVPIDLDYPGERVAFMTADAELCLLLHARDRLPPRDIATAVDLIDLCNEVDADQVDNPGVEIHEESLAYVIYTSGSTGVPKGVGAPHRGLPSRLRALEKLFPATPGDRVLQFLSPSFDASVLELLLALGMGATLHLANVDQLAAGDALIPTLRQEKITHVLLPPAVLALLPLVDLPALRYLAIGGERCSQHVALRWSHGRNVWNMYGPTETTIWSTAYQVVEGSAAGDRLPIGNAIPEVDIYVLNPDEAPVEHGSVGEVHIGGAGIARGYIGRPALTAERFLPDPFTDVPGRRMYRTGDLARVMENGSLEFMGRADGQVKLRGFRIELGEIEAALAIHPGVRAAAVRIWEDAATGGRLTAYVVPSEQQTISERELRGYLEAGLPTHMIPACFVVQAGLPMTPNGKIDRNALPLPPARNRIVSPPRTETERRIAAIWQDVLQRDDLGIDVDEDFYQQGGNSLLAACVSSRLRSEFGYSPPLRELLSVRTVATLAALVDARGSQGAPHPPPIPFPSRRADRIPLSFAQERIWFFEQLEPGTCVYNIPLAARFQGVLDLGSVRTALEALFDRHDALRMTFCSDERGVFQRIGPPSAFTCRVVDLSPLSPSRREAEVRRHVETMYVTPFELCQGPLIRGQLLVLGPEETVLLLSLHHSVADGWSVGVLFRDLGILYTEAREGTSGSLPALRVHYADLAARQREWLAQGEMGRQLAYWISRLRTAEPLRLPTDRPHPPRRRYRGSTLRFRLSASQSERISTVCRDIGLAPSAALLGMFTLALSWWCDQDDLVIGTLVAGRTDRDMEDLIGFFVNTLALRIAVPRSVTGRAFMHEVAESLVEALEHQDVPFQKVVEALAPVRQPGRQPYLDAVYIFQNTPRGALVLDGLRAKWEPIEDRVSLFDLALHCSEFDGEYFCALQYDTDLFESSTISDFASLLTGVIDTFDLNAPLDLPRSRSSAPPARATGVSSASAHVVGTPLRLAEPLVRQLTEIWSEVLGVTHVDPESNFFSMGGHSLLALVLRERVRARLGCEIPLRLIFEAGTIAAMAERLPRI